MISFPKSLASDR